MSLTRKTITVSDKQEAWIKSRIASGDFTNDSEYLRDLIRKDQERMDKAAQLQALITEGIESGFTNQSVEEIWAEARRGK